VKEPLGKVTLIAQEQLNRTSGLTGKERGQQSYREYAY